MDLRTNITAMYTAPSNNVLRTNFTFITNLNCKIILTELISHNNYRVNAIIFNISINYNYENKKNSYGDVGLWLFFLLLDNFTLGSQSVKPF